MGENVYKNGPK